MAKAIWNTTVLAQSDDCVEVEGNLYFPRQSIDCQYFRPSETTSVCGWKGTANYFHIEVDGQVNPDAAWQYAEPKPAAARIRGRIAFWKGIRIER
ncbi:MAG: DUF427 domain-containing protein [Bryobacterales bacterium]|nr:DUF427 domain-containing protein [Bryobacterales bacterium]